jgi:rhamnosyltransferase subunit B
MSEHQASRKRIVMTTLGSLGDLHPYFALAAELQSRGHQPVLATTEIYRQKCAALGIEFFPVRPHLPGPDDPAGVAMIAKVMDLKHGGEYLLREVLLPAVRGAYEDLGVAIRGADMLVTHPITFAGPILAQKTRIPWVSTVLAPLSLWSDQAPHVLGNLPWFHPVVSFGGPRASRALRKLIDLLTNPWMEPLYALREELGLPRGRHPVFEGQYSPQLNLALFSKVLCERQPDWSPNTRITGFPFYDGEDNAVLSPELMDFLDAGAAPLVFTLGSAAVHVPGAFFAESIAAARLLKRRAVLLVGKDAHKLQDLPEGIVAFDYAPFSALFPRAAAVVHQGGVGTTGQALRAGVPTLIVPFSHDQPDNAARTVRIGTGRTVALGRYKAQRVAKELQALLDQASYRERASAIGEEVRAEHGARTAVDLMLELLPSPAALFT